MNERAFFCSPNRLIVDEATNDDNSGELRLTLAEAGYLIMRFSRNSQPRNNGDAWSFPRRYYNCSVCIHIILVLMVVADNSYFLSGKKRRDTVLICLSSDDVEDGRIQMNKVARNNLRVKLGDLVNVHQCLDIKYGKRVHILPFDDSIEGLSGNIFDVYLKPYFLEGTRNHIWNDFHELT